MSHPPKPPPPDLREKGADIGGQPQHLDRRLYCQLQVFTGAERTDEVMQAFSASGLQGAFYLDAIDPHGVATLVIAEDPAIFTGRARDLFNTTAFAKLTRRPELAMFGRTYSTGREPDLEWWLLKKPLEVALNRDLPWAVWYPLRRKPEFALLTAEEQGKILYEHAVIGMAYGEIDAAHDIRLACHGIDTNDNEFIIGLHGRELHPLSRIVQEMRKTQQTAKFIQTLGPFFVGRAAWQSPMPPS
jgi:chlorite dismutase